MFKKITLALLLTLFVGTTYATQPVVVVPQRIVQFDSAYFTGVNGYYQAGQTIAQEKQAVQEDKLDKIAGSLDQLIKILSGGKVEIPAAAPVVPVPPKPQTDTLSDQINALFKTKCYNCHKDASNGTTLFDKDGKVDVDVYGAINVHFRTEGLALNGKARMPKNGTPLSNSEMILIKKWLHSFVR
jgi:hypothetical protein